MIVDSEECRACIKKHCKVTYVNDRSDCNVSFEKLWDEEQFVCCPEVLSRGGALVRVGGKKPEWCEQC